MAKFNRSRIYSHIGLIIFSVLACALAYLYAVDSTFEEVLTIGFGYEGLLLLAVTLLIGPFNLLRKRRNPVNIDFRRDVGIWAGITGVLHVIFSFQIYPTEDFWSFFFNKPPQNYVPRLDLFGASNYIGLAATLLMVALLVTSNTLSLKWLKGKRWKALQRFNYPLAVLTIIHTVAFQVINLRENWFFIATIGLSVIVLAVQLGGVALTLNRNRKRTEQHGAPALVPATAGGDRRKFIITGASLVVGGFVGGTMIGNQLFKGGSSGSAIAANTTQATQATTTTPAQQGRVEFPQAPGNREGRQRPGFNQTTPGTQTTPGSQVNPGNSGRPVEPGSRNFPGNSTTSPAQSGTTATPAPATTQAASNSGATGNSRVVLATTANLKPGDALKFTTPDTKETAFLVREKDGSVKAFNAICTHRPYMLVWNSNRQALVCDLHAVDFDGVTGAPRNRPARTALKAYSVAIDGQGNIVYNIA